MKYLPPREQGVLVLLLLFSTVAKIVFRMGLDGGFLRVYYDQKTDAEKHGFVFTIASFSALTGAVLLTAVVLTAESWARWLLGDASAAGARFVALAAADIYVGTFVFVPLALLRIQDRPRLFAALVAGRNFVSMILKVAFLVAGYGITGVLWSDLLGTSVLALALLPTLLRHARPVFHAGSLREALRFGLPKTPHGLMLQLLNLGDRKLLEIFRDLATVGIYDKGYVLGAGVKFALSAFEPAWQPFVYGQIGKPDAPATLARVATYAWAAFVGVGLAVAVFGRELLMVLTFTNPAFWAGASVVPVITLAYLLHGAFLLTSIGIGISKDTRYYPMITTAAAVTNLGANLWLIPRFGMLGAAWATVLAYAAMAAAGFVLSRRLYPIPFEGGRLARLSAAALVSLALSWLAPEALLPALAVKTAAIATFPALVWLSGFLTREEAAWLKAHLAASRAGVS